MSPPTDLARGLWVSRCGWIIQTVSKMCVLQVKRPSSRMWCLSHSQHSNFYSFFQWKAFVNSSHKCVSDTNHSVINIGCTENQRSQRPIIQLCYCLTLGSIFKQKADMLRSYKKFLYSVSNCMEKSQLLVIRKHLLKRYILSGYIWMHIHICDVYALYLRLLKCRS